MSAMTHSHAHHDVASRAAALSVASNLVLMILKLSVGLMFGSVAVLGDGIDSAEDLFASGLAFFTVRLALQPADESHPYGHGKAESLAALSQAALIGGGAIFIAIAAIRRALADDTEIHVGPSLATMGIAAVVNLGVAAYSMRAARMSGSVAIAADARHLATNVVQALAVATGLVLVGVTGNQIYDPIVALILAAYLLWIAGNILRDALRELVDSALPEEMLDQIRNCLGHESHQMRGYHDLRTRKSGREIQIDVHVLVDPGLTVSEAHRLTEHLESDLKSSIQGAVVTVHVDPDEPDLGCVGGQARAV
jgi:cation diffusion facilitator family transporter